MSNLLTSVFPFAFTTLMIAGTLMGSRLPVARREAVGRAVVIALVIGGLSMLFWLLLRSNNPRLKASFFVPLAVMLPMLSRLFVRTPRARRIFLAALGVLTLALGFGFPYLLPDIRNVMAFQVFRWAMVFCGVMMIVAAWGNWRPPDEPEEGGRLRPATGRPPRHFGNAL